MFEMSPGKCSQFRLDLNVLTHHCNVIPRVADLSIFIETYKAQLRNR